MPKTKVHPNAADPVLTVSTYGACTGSAAAPDPDVEEPPTVLTVWRKSLLFNCDGFTVFDARGNLAFRVDSYSYDAASCRRRRAEVVLMDATGTPLLTVRCKRRLGMLVEHWVIYDGDAAADDAETERSNSDKQPLLSVRRRRASSKEKALAYVTPLLASSSSSGYRRTTVEASYVVEGSYGRQSCAVQDAREDAVMAEVRRKEAVVGDDVFRLGATLAMGLIIALDEMFAGGRSATRSLSLLGRTRSA